MNFIHKDIPIPSKPMLADTIRTVISKKYMNDNSEL